MQFASWYQLNSGSSSDSFSSKDRDWWSCLKLTKWDNNFQGEFVKIQLLWVLYCTPYSQTLNKTSEFFWLFSCAAKINPADLPPLLQRRVSLAEFFWPWAHRGWAGILSARPTAPLMKDAHCWQPWGENPSSLATQAEFPSEMLSRTRHLASAKRGRRRRRRKVEVMGAGDEREGWRREEVAGLNGRTMAECTRVSYDLLLSPLSV